MLRPTVVMLGVGGFIAIEMAVAAVPVFELGRKHLELGSSVAVTCEMVGYKSLHKTSFIQTLYRWLQEHLLHFPG